MKSQNKSNRLAFNKAAVTELNNNVLNGIKGGQNTTETVQTTYLCGDCILLPKSIRTIIR